MSVEVWILVATAILAVVAIGAAIVAVRAVRRVTSISPAPTAGSSAAPTVAAPGARRPADIVVHEPAPVVRPTELEPRILEGRLVVPPTQQQVVQTALGRPGVRLSVFAHGAAHALRAESRDRISALMRRDYRRRRRERLQAGRRAARSIQPSPPSDQSPSDQSRANQWLGS